MFARRLQQLNPYKPGEQPKDREYIKLNANENPYEPSPKVAEALKNIPLKKLGLYELVSMLLTVTVCRLSNMFN